MFLVFFMTTITFAFVDSRNVGKVEEKRGKTHRPTARVAHTRPAPRCSGIPARNGTSSGPSWSGSKWRVAGWTRPVKSAKRWWNRLRNRRQTVCAAIGYKMTLKKGGGRERGKILRFFVGKKSQTDSVVVRAPHPPVCSHPPYTSVSRHFPLLSAICGKNSERLVAWRRMMPTRYPGTIPRTVRLPTPGYRARRCSLAPNLPH